MIYDCFCYNGEKELLEIRLNELGGIVDVFVICEATHTFSGKPKDMQFPDFNSFPKRTYEIRPLIYDATPDDNALQNAYKQNNYLINGLKDAKPDDLILINDLDELPNRYMIKWLRRITQPHVFKMYMSHYYFNYKIRDFWLGTVITPFRFIDTINNMRERRFTYPRISAGWHFSFLGDPETISHKIQSYGHQEFNRLELTDIKKIKERIVHKKDPLGRWWKWGVKIKYIPLDFFFPKYILENKDKFSHLIANA